MLSFMKLPSAIALGIACLCNPASAQQAAESVGIVRAGSGTPTPGAATYFTGKVEVRPMVSPQPPARTSLAAVTFQEGARSNWHTHPAGQMLFVTDGCGWTQREGGKIERICKGDTAFVPAGVKHWHGATATTSMTHLAITETLDGKNVEWMEQVSDSQYAEGPAEK